MLVSCPLVGGRGKRSCYCGGSLGSVGYLLWVEVLVEVRLGCWVEGVPVVVVVGGLGVVVIVVSLGVLWGS